MEGTRSYRQKHTTAAFPGGRGGFPYVRPASLCGDDWERGFDSRTIPGTIAFPEDTLTWLAELRRIGICVPETPGLCRHESQTTDSIISDASTLPFAGPRCSTKILDANGSSPVKTRTFPYRHSVRAFLQLVETDQNQPLVGDKYELQLVWRTTGYRSSDDPQDPFFGHFVSSLVATGYL